MACLYYLPEIYNDDIMSNSYVVNDGQLEIYLRKWDKQVKIHTNAKFQQTNYLKH